METTEQRWHRVLSLASLGELSPEDLRSVQGYVVCPSMRHGYDYEQWLSRVLASVPAPEVPQAECGRCGAVGPTTHVHYDSDGDPYECHDCAFAGHAYDPDACDGDDFCDACLEQVFAGEE